MIGRWLAKLSPPRLKHEAVAAEEQEAETTTTLMAAVEAQEVVVNHLASRMRSDRLENHYAERVAAALGRNHP